MIGLTSLRTSKTALSSCIASISVNMKSFYEFFFPSSCWFNRKVSFRAKQTVLDPLLNTTIPKLGFSSTHVTPDSCYYHLFDSFKRISPWFLIFPWKILAVQVTMILFKAKLNLVTIKNVSIFYV